MLWAQSTTKDLSPVNHKGLHQGYTENINTTGLWRVHNIIIHSTNPDRKKYKRIADGMQWRSGMTTKHYSAIGAYTMLHMTSALVQAKTQQKTNCDMTKPGKLCTTYNSHSFVVSNTRVRGKKKKRRKRSTDSTVSVWKVDTAKQWSKGTKTKVKHN